MATTLKFVTQYGIENVGAVSISSGTASNPGISLSSDENSGIFSPGDNILAFSTDGVERLRFSPVGALGISGANYGTSGQLLTSNGDGSAPTWQSVSAVTSVAVSGGSTGLTTSGGPVTSSGTITLAGTLAIANGGTGTTSANGAFNALAPSQAGNSGKYLTSDGSSTSWSAITSVSTLANATVLGTSNTSISITGKTSATYADAPMTIQAGPGQYTGNTLTVSGGTGGAQGGGSLVLCAGTGYYLSSGTAGTVTVHADNSTGNGGAVEMRGGDGQIGGGALTLRGGDSTGNSAVNGAVSIRGGNGSGTTTGGAVTISGGTGGTAGGALVFKTATTTSLTEKFRILANGAWSVGSDGTSYGSSAQVLTSNGNAAPTWQAVPSSLPSQTSNSGKYLTTDGSTASWATVSAGSSFTGGTVANATTFSSSVAFGARYDELRSDVTASSTTNFDCSVSNVANVTLSASITSLTFSNIPASGRVFTLTLFLNQDATGSRTVAWPAAVKWPAAAAPTLTTTASKTDIITLVTHDGGTNWYGFVAGQNF